jgi:diguanylate cyclase (GGDEF)-like protein/PAS domain S-box-containing protein
MIYGAAGSERRPSLLASYAAGLARLRERGLAEVAIERGRALARVDATIRAVVEQSFDGILVFDAAHRVVMANDAAACMFDRRRPDELVGLEFGRLFPGLPLPDLHRPGEQRRTGRTECEGRRHGGGFPVELSLCRISVEGERQLVATVRDVSERRAQEKRLRHQATHDALTDLANRTLLQSTLDGAIERLGADGGRLALLLLDLDRFKEVNDTLGHQVGDLLLVEVARRVAHAVRGGDLVARLGGDEFAVLLRDAPQLDDALEVARRIVEAIQQPFELSDLAVTDVDASIGIALAPDHSTDTIDLLRCADVAMYAAKRGTSPIEVYDASKDPHCRRRLVASTAIRRAIRNEEFTLLYQPQFCLRTGALVGAEALLRWHHPEHGAIEPSEFIAVAEQTGSIVQLTHWIVNTAIDQLAAWRRHGLEIGVAVNIAARSVHDERLPELVATKMTRLGLPPGLLTMELTEHGVIAGTEATARVLGRLRQFGVRLSVDDFGTGYSSLALLQRLSVHELKIDASFVAGMARNEQDRVLVRSTVDLAQNLGIVAVAEGIETQGQLDELRAIGCKVGQGYLLGRPVRPDEILGLATTARGAMPQVA